MECFFIPGNRMTIEPYDVEPIEGFKLPKNFPNHSEFYKKVKAGAEEWFDKFPNCCENHRKEIAEHANFRKQKYSGVIDKILRQVAFTVHLIVTRINNDDWYADITDYFEHNIESFGHPRIGDHVYRNSLKSFIETSQAIPNEKRKPLLAYFDPVPDNQKPVEITDVKILLNTYAKWLKLFPFELTYLHISKKAFERSLPLLAEDPKVNRYSNLAKAPMTTLDGLIQHLFSLTKLLLSKVDSVTQFNEGSITEPDKLRLELVNTNHRIATDTLLNEYTSGERKYIKTIKRWLAQEKQYFKDISELINSKPKKQETPIDKVETELSKYGFDELSKVKALNAIKRQELTTILKQKPLPYKIAMLNYLGFIESSVPKHFSTKFKLNKALADIFETDERDIRGNINVLNPISNERRNRYTAHLHKETVEKDYQNLK